MFESRDGVNSPNLCVSAHGSGGEVHGRVVQFVERGDLRWHGGRVTSRGHIAAQLGINSTVLSRLFDHISPIYRTPRHVGL